MIPKNTNPAIRVATPWEGLRGLTNKVGQRSAAKYEEILAQFPVDHARYTIRDTSGDGRPDTFCNIHSTDVSWALDAPIPHLVDMADRPLFARQPGDRELSANATSEWLRKNGKAYGWEKVTAQVAQLHNLAGGPAFAVWRNPTGKSGHIAPLRPTPTGKPQRIQNVGAVNFRDDVLTRAFGAYVPEYWIHA